MRPELLAILACPATRQPLRLASAQEVEKLRTQTERGELRRVDGSAVPSVPLEGALVTEDGTIAYRIQGGIPILLVKEGIILIP